MAAADVLSGNALWSAEASDCIAWMDALPEQSVDLVFGSPPYCEARTYGEGISYDCLEWVEWMLKVTAAAQRVCRGPVFWVAAGVTRDRNYWPACEGLLWEWWKRGGECQLYRPCAWVKTDNEDGGTGIPGSGGDDYLRADWEYIMCFKRPGVLAWSDNTAMGHTPKYSEVGGEMSNRNADGRRINQEVFGHPDGFGGKFESIGNRAGNGKRKYKTKNVSRQTMEVSAGHDADGNLGYATGRPMPKLANPGNVVKARVGGGHMGSKLCHEGEAPFPERLPEFFIRSFCPEGGIVLEPFGGSGTTPSVAIRWARRCICCDLRQSQVDLIGRRMAESLDLFTSPEIKAYESEPPLLFDSLEPQ